MLECSFFLRFFFLHFVSKCWKWYIPEALNDRNQLTFSSKNDIKALVSYWYGCYFYKRIQIRDIPKYMLENWMSELINACFTFINLICKLGLILSFTGGLDFFSNKIEWSSKYILLIASDWIYYKTSRFKLNIAKIK